MRFGQLLIPTVREDPADAEVASFDVLLMDANGRVLMEVEEFSIKKLDGEG